MGKKIIRLTESQLNRVIKSVVKEQQDYLEHQFIRAVQTFLNEKINAKLKVDGLTGRNSKTEEAIAKYQHRIGVYPTDGVWGVKTWDAMPEADRIRLKKLVAKEGGPVDMFLNWIGIG